MLIALLIACAAWLAATVVSWVAWSRLRTLRRELRIDSLTGLGNRRAFEVLIDRGGVTDASATLAVIDLDRFKDINDTFGHVAGDETLHAVAERMQQLAETLATEQDPVRVYRFGGDEFAMVFHGRDTDAVTDALVTLRNELEHLDLSHKRRVRMSAGVASAPEHAADWGTLLARADRALYQAKQGGRDRVTLYTAEMSASASEEEDPLALLKVIATAVVGAVDARDSYTHAHSHNVADLAGYMARTMGLPEEHVNEIALAALLHDIGKIGVSDAVLKKPGSLDRDEWMEMQTHCEIGHRILNAIPGAERIREMVYAHHERPDGKGYPRNLKLEDIPIGARIICVADAFDSMTANRVYRAAMDPQVALREIARLRGEQFDVDAVDAICELMLYVPEEVTTDADGAKVAQLPAARYEGRDRTAVDDSDEADDVAAA